MECSGCGVMRLCRETLMENHELGSFQRGTAPVYSLGWRTARLETHMYNIVAVTYSPAALPLTQLNNTLM